MWTRHWSAPVENGCAPAVVTALSVAMRVWPMPWVPLMPDGSKRLATSAGKPTNGAAVAIYERQLKGKPSSLDDTMLRLGRAAKAAGDLTKAAEAFARVYYEFALSPSAVPAGTTAARRPRSHSGP